MDEREREREREIKKIYKNKWVKERKVNKIIKTKTTFSFSF